MVLIFSEMKISVYAVMIYGMTGFFFFFIAVNFKRSRRECIAVVVKTLFKQNPCLVHILCSIVSHKVLWARGVVVEFSEYLYIGVRIANTTWF